LIVEAKRVEPRRSLLLDAIIRTLPEASEGLQSFVPLRPRYDIPILVLWQRIFLCGSDCDWHDVCSY